MTYTESDYMYYYFSSESFAESNPGAVVAIVIVAAIPVLGAVAFVVFRTQQFKKLNHNAPNKVDNLQMGETPAAPAGGEGEGDTQIKM